MKAERVTVVLVLFLLLSTSAWIGGILSFYLLNDTDANGEWYLTWESGQNFDGTVAPDIFETSAVLSITTVAGGQMNGQIDGIGFVGSSKGDLIRFSIDLQDGRTAEVMGSVATYKVMKLIAVVSGGTGILCSYSLFFTKDSVLPYLIDDIQIHITGEWVANATGPGTVRDACMEVTDQDAALFYGTMDLGDGTVGFSAAISIVENRTMNSGILVDENGTVWTLSMKKGMILMFSVRLSDNSIEEVSVCMVRDQCDAIVSTPIVFDIGVTWIGKTGYGSDGEEKGLSADLIITGQGSGIITGKIVQGSTEYVFIGTLFSSSPIAAELTVFSAGSEMKAILFVNGDTMTIVIPNGGLIDDICSMVFRK